MKQVWSKTSTYNGAGRDIIHLDTDGVMRGACLCRRADAIRALRGGSQLVVDGERAHINYTRVPQPDGSTVPGYMSNMSTSIPF